MHAIIILCLASVALGAPQGYNYPGTHQPHQHYGSAAGAIQKESQSSMQLAVNQNQVAPKAPLYQAPQPATSLYVAPAGAAISAIATVPIYQAPTPTVATLPFLNSQRQQQQQERSQQPAEAIISKRFFLHSAPEEEEEQREEKFITVGKARKNYNVVFIKAPSKSAQRTSVKIAPAANEEKTVIYVLAKKTDDADIDAQVLEAATTTAKPEVYFIKYKTNEEAAHAQQTIQAQYDSLGGSTQITNEGQASVSSVIGILDAPKQQAAIEAESAQVGTFETQNEVQYTQSQMQQVQQPTEQEVVTSVQQVQSLTQDATNAAYLPPSRFYY